MSETSTSSAAALEQLRARVEQILSAPVQLVEIHGNRWSYLAGPLPSADVSPGHEKIPITDRHGLIVYGADSPARDRREQVRALIRSFLQQATPAVSKTEILNHLVNTPAGTLFAQADAVRRQHCGDTVYVRGIVEFSNCCVRNCHYCGLRKDNRKLNRYRMKPEEIVEAVSTVAQRGLHTVILQSGDDLSYTRETICGILGEIRRRHPGMAVTLSIGERPLDDYRAFKDSGADRYLIKHETINPHLYQRLHPGQSHEHRLSIIQLLRKLEYQVGVGFIVGLPGQAIEDLADEILFLQEFQPDMAGIGPFLPQGETLLYDQPPGDRDLLLRVLALARLAAPRTHLPATTALATLDPKEGYLLGLKAGCNVIMVNCTPLQYRENYQIYDHRERFALEDIKQVIGQAGRRFSGERGDSLMAGA